MRSFSKSRLIAMRQCPKRLWLDVFHSELGVQSMRSEKAFRTGHQVGEVARRIYDPEHAGELINLVPGTLDAAFCRTSELLNGNQPIFEAGFSAAGAHAFADVLLPEVGNRRKSWRMIEVKSTTSVKDYQRDDVAIQAFVARSAGIPLSSVSVAHIDSSWVYPGNQDYRGLLTEVDLTDEAFARHDEVTAWVAQAQQVVSESTQPDVCIGEQCGSPFPCSYFEYCSRGQVAAEYPLEWLPRISVTQRRKLAALGIDDLGRTPDNLLNPLQRRVKHHTLDGTVFFDSAGAAATLEPYGFPAYFLDFETIRFPIPAWPGTRPYQQIPFQFSLHVLSESGILTHDEFLDAAGNDPSESFAKTLLSACGQEGPVYVYSAKFEASRIRELALRFPIMGTALMALIERIVDLLPVAQEYFYHPSQHGSWSIKSVLPAAVPELSYTALDGVKDGEMAMDAYLEAIDPETSIERKALIEQQLLAYCRLDTYAMVRLWQVFSGRLA